MIITTKELMAMSPGCVTNSGLMLWLRTSRIPFIQNGTGDVQVQERFRNLFAIAKDNITPMVNATRSFKRDEPGVYLLKHKGDVVYVGMTKSLFTRMEKHVRGDFKFDEIEFISTTKNDAPLLESELIGRYIPKYNQVKIPSSKRTECRIKSSLDVPVFAELTLP